VGVIAHFPATSEIGEHRTEKSVSILPLLLVLPLDSPMNTLLIIALICLSAVTRGFSEPPAPTKDEVIALMNKVQDRIGYGDVSALDQLLTLPGNWAVPAFLDIFAQFYNLPQPTATDQAMEARAAQLCTTVDGGEAYLVKLMRDKPEGSPNFVYIQQDNAINCLIFAHNNTSMRVLCSALDQPQMGGRMANALAMMGLPGAPYSSNNINAISGAKEVAQWKQWWKANGNDYPAMGNPKPAASPAL
jgi:hypothetical protein